MRQITVCFEQYVNSLSALFNKLLPMLVIFTYLDQASSDGLAT